MIPVYLWLIYAGNSITVYSLDSLVYTLRITSIHLHCVFNQNLITLCKKKFRLFTIKLHWTFCGIEIWLSFSFPLKTREATIGWPEICTIEMEEIQASPHVVFIKYLEHQLTFFRLYITLKQVSFQEFELLDPNHLKNF